MFSNSNKLLLQFALRYPVLVIATVVLGFSGALFNGVSTTLIVPVVLDFLGQDQLNVSGGPPIIRRMLSVFDGFTGENRLIAMTAAVLLAIILKNVTSYVSSLVGSYLSKSLVNDIRKEGIQLLLDVDIEFYAKTKVGDIINRLGQEVSRTAGSIRVLIRLFITVVTILVFVWILLLISWQLTLASTVLLILVTLPNQFYINRSKKFGKAVSRASKAYSSAQLEVLTGIRLIKSVSNEEQEFQRLNKLIKEREQAELQSQANSAAIGPINEVSGIIVVLAIVLLGRALFLQQLESLSAVLLTYLVVLFRLLPFVSQLNSARGEFANSVPSVEVVTDFLRRDNKPLMVSGGVPYTGFKDEIRFEGVSFAYAGSDDLVLNKIDLWIPKGKTLALVGASGAGKSTLVDLLPRFYDPTEGRITMDGRNMKEFDMHSLRKAMGIVSQDTFLFNDSVRNNIAYAWEKVTEEEVVEAAKRANAYEFIVNLPQGFDTTIGDRGVLLSGGQRQRIAIARALLRNPEILILDEATSALDTVSERLVQQAIEELCRDRTTVVIAHRLSTVQKADQIAVMEKGRVVELGTHEELLKKNGYYTRLYSMQFSETTQNVIKAAVNEALVKTSYEVRSRLNPMIGFLKLVVDDLVDSAEESRELTEEAYESAIRLLRTLEFLEESSKMK
ncbi:ABC transporter ATP-binding protein [Coleofasciculus sp. FACHB-T130]|uniref:ABC transporter ATP-binding protein n=1 Tax=Cyanophyceae TaxID=3028117 RepID=UPI00168537EA|nr:ABC transporter ATP-binding protein [Coleofasciculus sp. FACHB-T130]MBD1879923.1 ABC transporter ATP-binding protein [Coleofasciculus sp. FACHB-T130]